MQNGIKRMFFMKEKKTLVLREKYFNFKISICYENIEKKAFNGHPCQNVTTYFSIFFLSEHSAFFSLF